MWLHQKALQIQAPFKPASIMAQYFYLIFNGVFEGYRLAPAIEPKFFISAKTGFDNKELDASDLSDLSVDGHLWEVLNPIKKIAPNRKQSLNKAFEIVRKLNLDSEFQQSLRQLGDQLPDALNDEEKFLEWSQANGHTWIEQLRCLMIKHRNIGHDWQFSDKQKEMLEQYYEANLLLVECLNSDCYVSREVRSQIEDTLLLPIAEIEKRKQRQ
jgi:hypothetical protein